MFRDYRAMGAPGSTRRRLRGSQGPIRSGAMATGLLLLGAEAPVAVAFTGTGSLRPGFIAGIAQRGPRCFWRPPPGHIVPHTSHGSRLITHSGSRRAPLVFSSPMQYGGEEKVVLEAESPVLLQADVEGLPAEALKQWVHAWCSRKLAGAEGAKSSAGVPGLPSTSLPVKPELTDRGARLVCEGLGPSFFDMYTSNTLDDKASLVVRRSLSDSQMSRHSASIRGLARDTEATLLQQLRRDLAATRVRGGSLKVHFNDHPRMSDNRRAEAFAAPLAPPPSAAAEEGLEEVKRRVQDVEDMLQSSGKEEEGEGEGEGGMSEEEAMRSIMETLPSLDLQSLEAEMGLGAETWASPESPFAQKAVEAYQAFATLQKDEAKPGGLPFKELVAETLELSAAGPEQVQNMFKQGLESVASLHEEVEAKSKAQRRTLQTIQSFGTHKEQEAQRQKDRDTSGGLVTLQMMFEGTGLKGGLDILAGPPGERAVDLPSLDEMVAGGDALQERLRREQQQREQGSSDGELGIDEVISLMRDAEEGEEEEGEEEEEEEMESYWSDRAWDVAQRFEVLVQEAQAAPEDMFASIAKEYHNVFLSPHFIPLTRYRMAEVDSEEDRALLLRLVKYAQDLVLQLQEMSELLEMQQLDKIRAICQVAEQDMNKLSEYVGSRKEELDEDFIKYLNYLIQVETDKQGAKDSQREPSTWLMILQIIKKGVYHELGKAIKNDVSMVHFITRFEEEDERDYLARAHINRLLPSQVLPFKKVVTQMVDNFESRVDELNDVDLELAGRVLQVEDILEDMYPRERLMELLQSKEGRIGGMEAIMARAEALMMHDPREFDTDAVQGLWDPEHLAARYDHILRQYGYTASQIDEKAQDREDQAKARLGMGRRRNAAGQKQLSDATQNNLPIGSPDWTPDQLGGDSKSWWGK